MITRTQKRQPTLSPLEALQRLRAAGGADIDHEGFTYVLDGCMGTPSEALWPCVSDADDHQWSPTGEPDQPITADDTWVEV